MKKDNTTLSDKVSMRQIAMRACPPEGPVLETHGGWGRIYERCYDRRRGMVIEKDAAKAAHLAEQRPDWRVYQGDCAKALAAGLGDDMPFAMIDVDPYGSPFAVLESIFKYPRALADHVQLVVNDGLRQKVRIGGAWTTECFRDVVRRRGNNLYPIYLDVARELVSEIVAVAGYRLAAWQGRYTGHNNDMTHYYASLKRDV